MINKRINKQTSKQANKQTIIYTLLVTNLYAVILLLSEISYRIVFNIPQIIPSHLFENYLLIYLFIVLFYFAKYRLSQLFILFFFFLCTIVNNLHYTVYLSWTSGLHYLLAFTEHREATNVAVTILDKLALPFIWGLIELVFFATIARFRQKTFVYSDALFLILIAYISVRSFSSGQQLGISPKTDYSRVKATYFSFGYFLGHTLPYHFFDLSTVPSYNAPSPQKISTPKIKNIIFIVGESETVTHMNYFGYDRPTTPFLNQLSQKTDAVIKKTYAAGLGTALSLPTLFNAIAYPNGIDQISKGSTNLFNLAKMQGFNTYFYSAQAQQEMAMMNLLGLPWIDKLIFPTNLGFSPYASMSDLNLLPEFRKIDLKNGYNFVILHQRGSHGPYEGLLTPEEKVFGSTDFDNYDSTILKTDNLIKQVYEYLNNQENQDWLLVYTSDHGQYVTKEVFNQGTVMPDNYTVPTLIYSPNKEIQAQAENAFSPCKTAYHQQVATFLIHTLGYDMPISDCKKGVVLSGVLSGDEGYLQFDEEGKMEYIYPKKK